MNTYIKYLLILTIIITSISSISFVNSAITTNTVNYAFSGTGLSIDIFNDHNIMIYCSYLSCESYGANTSIVRVIENTNVTSRDDYTNIGHSTYISNSGDNIGKYPSTPEFYPSNNINYPNFYKSFGLNNYDLRYIYTYDSTNDFWSFTNISESFFSSNNYHKIYAILNQRSSFNNYESFFVGQSNDGSANYPAVLNHFNISTSTELTGGIYLNESLFMNKEGTASSNIYTSRGIYHYKTGVNLANFTYYDNFRFGILIPSDNFYIYLDGDSSIFVGNYSDLNSSWSGGTNINSLSGCDVLLGNVNQYVSDIDCKNRDNCVFVGEWSSSGFVVSYNGVECTLLTVGFINSSDSFEQVNLTDRALLNVEYDDGATSYSNDDYYYVVGNQTLFKFASGTVTPTIFTYEACITPNQYCSNATSSGNLTYCLSYVFVTPCSDGCFNNSNVYSCINTCTNNCTIIGSRTCFSSNSYSVCDDLNSDGCYEWGSGINCLSTQYCQPSGDFYATCQLLPVGNTVTNTLFTVLPYYTNSNDTSYSLDTSSKVVTVDTRNSVHIQKFTTSALNSSYTSRTCDYKELNVYNMNTVSTINTSTDYVFTTTATSSYVKTSIVPQNEQEIVYIISDAVSTSSNSIKLLRNITQKRLDIMLLNGSIIYTDISSNTYDDLTSIDIYVYYDFVTHTNNMRFQINRNTPVVVTTIPKSFSGNDISKVTLNSSNVTINSIDVISYTVSSGFQSNSLSFDYLPCIYTNTGTYKVRTYNNNNGYPDYTNYFDYTVKINSLSSASVIFDTQTNTFINSLFGTNLSTSQKLFYTVMIMFVTIAFIIIIGISFGMSGLLTGVLASGLSVVELIFFALIGFIPAWIIIMLAIICAGIIGVFGKKVFVQ